MGKDQTRFFNSIGQIEFLHKQELLTDTTSSIAHRQPRNVDCTPILEVKERDIAKYQIIPTTSISEIFKSVFLKTNINFLNKCLSLGT